LAVGLLISTNLAPLITIAAQNANYTMPSGATQISSICDGANPLTWLIVRINDFGWIGMAVIAVVAISLAIINRKRILKEAHEMEQKA
jgi:PTS system galactitol-specific IIC component